MLAPMELCRAFLGSEYTCGRKELGCSQGLEVSAVPIVTCLGPRGACLLVAWVVPRAQYGGEGRREGPEEMKEDPRKVKCRLSKAMRLLSLHLPPGSNHVFGPQFPPSQLTSRQKQSPIPASC